MKLHSLKINGFRRLKEAEIRFGDATFLIGPNNCGKSSVLKAIDLLLSAKPQAHADDFFAVTDPDTGDRKTESKIIILEAEFRNVPAEAKDWRGFKGRLIPYETDIEGDTGQSIIYRKTFELGGGVKVELRQKKRELKAAYTSAKTLQDYVDAGLDPSLIENISSDPSKNLVKKEKEKIFELDELWDISDDEEEWFENPGGIPGIVLNRLPTLLIIPAEASAGDIEDKAGALTKTLNALFDIVRDASENYKLAQKHLDDLAKELDPADQDSEFGKMMDGLNDVLGGVFPETSIHASANLSDPNSSLKPTFDVTMKSNIRTPVQYQGTGVVRSAVFALLRYRQAWLSKQEGTLDRGLIIGFEEPEIYLHPSAANQMRETIYDLTENSSQIVATTHSPYLIDLSKKPRQVLNRLHTDEESVRVEPFSVSDEFQNLQDDDKSLVKMLLKIDDHIARMFFVKKIIIIEGDTEDILIRRFLETVKQLDRNAYLKIRRDFEIIKARGKAAIIGLAKYLNALGVNYVVMHDADSGVAGAEKMNAPILETVGDKERVVILENCVEDALGYPPPSSEKPFKAYQHAQKWDSDLSVISSEFRNAMRGIFGAYLDEVMK